MHCAWLLEINSIGVSLSGGEGSRAPWPGPFANGILNEVLFVKFNIAIKAHVRNKRVNMNDSSMPL